MACKYLCWIVTLVEIVVIIVAKYLPDWRYSALIISVLSYNGHVEAIRISPMFIFGISLTLLGASLRAWCYRELGTLFTFEVCIRDDHRLIQTGPYRLVRHPGYAGALLTVAGVVCWNASPGSCVAFTGALLVMSITVGLLMRMSKEDEALKNWFGEDWNRWRNTVPYKLVPGIF
ncbi:hypothetical protein C8F01DRAFT_1103955 [Mycena amicta]|nr:hypothetical protein C8F01DRAFT_1103955 [Mycena amicta]